LQLLPFHAVHQSVHFPVPAFKQPNQQTKPIKSATKLTKTPKQS